MHRCKSHSLQLIGSCSLSSLSHLQYFVKAPLAIAKAPLRIDAVHLFVRLSVAKIRTQKTQRDFLKKTKQFRSIDDK